MSDQLETDMRALLDVPAFRRFVARSIQSAGVIAYSGPGADGADGRDLAFAEGRRSLGFDLLRDVEAGLPVPLRQPPYLHALLTILHEEAQPPTEKPNARRHDRYADDRDDDGRDG